MDAIYRVGKMIFGGKLVGDEKVENRGIKG